MCPVPASVLPLPPPPPVFVAGVPAPALKKTSWSGWLDRSHIPNGPPGLKSQDAEPLDVDTLNPEQETTVSESGPKPPNAAPAQAEPANQEISIPATQETSTQETSNQETSNQCTSSQETSSPTAVETQQSEEETGKESSGRESHHSKPVASEETEFTVTLYRPTGFLGLRTEPYAFRGTAKQIADRVDQATRHAPLFNRRAARRSAAAVQEVAWAEKARRHERG